MLKEINEHISSSEKRQYWPIYALFLVYFIYLGIRYTVNHDYWCLFSSLNLAIHEWGHYVFGFDGKVLAALGGSLLQLLVPLIAFGMFWYQRDFFAMCVCVSWFAINIYSVATYVADASAMVLPLVTPGGGVAKHDWNFILGEYRWLKYDTSIASVMRVFAFIFMWLGNICGAWILWVFAVNKKIKAHVENKFKVQDPPQIATTEKINIPDPPGKKHVDEDLKKRFPF